MKISRINIHIKYLTTYNETEIGYRDCSVDEDAADQ